MAIEQNALVAGPIETSTGYDPIIGVDPGNPPTKMTFSVLEDDDSGSGEVTRVAFELKIKHFVQQRMESNGNWKTIVNDNEKPFVVTESLAGTTHNVPGNQEYVIEIGTNPANTPAMVARLIVTVDFEMLKKGDTTSIENVEAVANWFGGGDSTSPA